MKKTIDERHETALAKMRASCVIDAPTPILQIAITVCTVVLLLCIFYT